MTEKSANLLLAEEIVDLGTTSFNSSLLKEAANIKSIASVYSFVWAIKKLGIIDEIAYREYTLSSYGSTLSANAIVDGIIKLNRDKLKNRNRAKGRKPKSAVQNQVYIIDGEEIPADVVGESVIAFISKLKEEIASLKERMSDYDAIINENTSLRERNSELCMQVNKIKGNSGLSIKDIFDQNK